MFLSVPKDNIRVVLVNILLLIFIYFFGLIPCIYELFVHYNHIVYYSKLLNSQECSLGYDMITKIWNRCSEWNKLPKYVPRFKVTMSFYIGKIYFISTLIVIFNQTLRVTSYFVVNVFPLLICLKMIY